MLLLLLSFLIGPSIAGYYGGGGVRSGWVCYPHLGCFQTDGPWSSFKRPVPPPLSPELIDVRAYFYSNDDPKKKIIVEAWPRVILNKIPFDPKRMTYFIIHGYQDGADVEWVMDMKDVLLSRRDANVFIGDWTRGAVVLSYYQACANLRVAAAVFVNLLNHLIKYQGLDISKLHLIGHSLGAQTCGQIGKKIPGIYRITAMDASQPMFQGEDAVVRLRKEDALHVDAVHADARPFVPDIGFGTMNRVGHIDYYINAGHTQPGCGLPQRGQVQEFETGFDFIKVPFIMLRNSFLCPHGRSHDFWLEAVNYTDCVMWGLQTSWTAMLRGVANGRTDGFFSKYLGLNHVCTVEDTEVCSPMGLESFQFPSRGSFVVNTRGYSPYCLQGASTISHDSQLQFIHRIVHAFIRAIKNKDTLNTGENDPGDYDFKDFDPETAW